MKNPFIDIAKIFGQPLDDAMPVDPILAEIAEQGTIECGDDAYYWEDYDTSVDYLYTAGNDGELISLKKSPVSASTISMIGLQSDLVYVTLQEMSSAKDQTPLARKKNSIIRAMNKKEVQSMLNLLLNIESQEVYKESGQDIYDGILNMVEKISDFGDNYVLLCGSEVYEAIQRYDKAMCVSFSYRMGINEMLKNNQIKLIKVLGNVKIDAGEYLPVLDPDKALLIAKNPSLVNSKPCLLIRRKFSAELSKAIGLDGEAQRMISTIGGVQIINNDKNILGIGIVGYENVGFAVTNYLATCYCNNLII